MASRCATSALICCLLAQTGCHEWVAVNPLDATKLGGSFAAPVGSNVVAIRVVDVRQPDGRLIELKGAYNVRITLKNGEVHELEHPVQVQEDRERLVFRSGNEAPLEVAPDDISGLEASRLDVGATAAVIVIVTLIGTAIIVGGSVALAESSVH
jgi:hypothetical protein